MPIENPGYPPTDGLTPEEDQLLVQLLSKWTGGPISTPVFTKLAGIIPQPIIEVVFLRGVKEDPETLLIPRPKDDIVWPGKVHNPGTALRTSDFYRKDRNPLNGAFERVRREIQNDFAYPPTFAGRLHRLTDRGPEVAEVYISGLLEETSLQPGQLWYPVNKLETNPNFLQGQIGHMRIAARFYLEN